MIPILYDKYETAFASNGLGRLADCISCTVTEERNGIYECQFTYPVTGEMFSEIQEGRIIAVIHDDTKDIQPFDIYAHSAPLNGVVTFYAHHISYRLGSVILKPMQAGSCVAALNAIPSNTYNRCPFTFWTDKAVSAQWENKVPSAVKAILGGQQGSILDVYGKGEYQWDKWLVRLYVNRGNDNGVSIRYGVNLTDLEQSYDESGSYNAVAPYWINREDGTVVTLSKGIVSANAGTRLVPWTTQSGEEITDRAGNPIYFEVGVPVTPVPMDLSDAFEGQPTEAQLEAEALRRLNSSEAWLPSENITVKFINLADTEEYKNVAALQRVSLCDRVSVYCGPLNVSAVKMQVIRVVYNVLTERYNEIELGKAKVSFTQSITAQVEDMTKDLPTVSMMQQSINNATDKITGAKGGHLLDIYDADGKRQEMVIMDTADVATAVKVWRWNLGGLGYSNNGYGGPYGLAITQDGAIVADFITVGTLVANIIKAGILSDASGKNYWNMETGEFSLAAATTVGGSTVESIAQNKANAAESNAKNYADGEVNALDESLTQQSVFNRLTNNGQTQGIYLKDGKLYINATYIFGGTLTLGGANNANGVLTVLDASGNTIGTWDNNGLTLNKGSIAGPSVTLGGSNNASGTLTVKDASGNTIGTWDSNGLTLDKGSINLNNGAFAVTSAGALTAINASLKGAFQTTGSDIRGNTINTRIASGKIRMFGNTDDGDYASWQPHAYLYIRALGGSTPETSITAYVPDFEISCAGYLNEHAGTLTLKASDGDNNNSSERGNVTIDAADVFFTDNSGSSTPLVKIVGGSLYGGGDRYVDFNVPVKVYNSFTVASGYTKSKVVTTDQYADRLLYCYETPSPLFGDVGEGVIGDDGLCYVTIDPIFAQTITTDNYQVFLQRYGAGDCWVQERKSGWFVVTGTPGLAFGWEIKGKQADIADVGLRRLDRNDEKFTVPQQTYGEDAAKHIDDLRKEREAA